MNDDVSFCTRLNDGSNPSLVFDSKEIELFNFENAEKAIVCLLQGKQKQSLINHENCIPH